MPRYSELFSFNPERSIINQTNSKTRYLLYSSFLLFLQVSLNHLTAQSSSLKSSETIHAPCLLPKLHTDVIHIQLGKCKARPLDARQTRQSCMQTTCSNLAHLVAALGVSSPYHNCSIPFIHTNQSLINSTFSSSQQLQQVTALPTQTCIYRLYRSKHDLFDSHIHRHPIICRYDIQCLHCL
jgi:hypothetical protein